MAKEQTSFFKKAKNTAYALGLAAATYLTSGCATNNFNNSRYIEHTKHTTDPRTYVLQSNNTNNLDNTAKFFDTVHLYYYDKQNTNHVMKLNGLSEDQNKNLENFVVNLNKTDYNSPSECSRFSPFVELNENNKDVVIGVKYEGSFRDFFSLFRPSAWKNPLKQGGSFCELNPVNWQEDYSVPLRSLTGKAIIIGGTYAATKSKGSKSSGSHYDNSGSQSTGTGNSGSSTGTSTSGNNTGGNNGGNNGTTNPGNSSPGVPATTTPGSTSGTPTIPGVSNPSNPSGNPTIPPVSP